MTGEGTVGGLQAVTVNTDLESGCAHASWVLGATPGPNTLTAAALASGSPLTFTAIATVSSGKLLYVANIFGNSITAYAAGASGNATPMVTIAGSNTGLNVPALITVVPSGPTGIPLSSQERIFTFDLTSHIPAPPYDAITWGVTFSVGDPVSGTDVLLTNLYGAANGTQLLQNRNDTQLITAGGTMYGPLQTANPIFNPMLDGIFSFGLVMTSGTAVVTEFKVCGVIFAPFQQTCTSIP